MPERDKFHRFILCLCCFILIVQNKVPSWNPDKDELRLLLVRNCMAMSYTFKVGALQLRWFSKTINIIPQTTFIAIQSTIQHLYAHTTPLCSYNPPPRPPVSSVDISKRYMLYSQNYSFNLIQIKTV